MNAPSRELLRPRLLLPLLLLLPGVALAWPGPGAPLADDPFPHLAGAALVALLGVPAALLLPFALRGRPGVEHVRGLPLLLVLLGLIGIAALLGGPTDTTEARRAAVAASTWPALFVGGALLDAGGRRLFNRGLVILSIAWTAGALFLEPLGGARGAGVLGNSGPLSQAALPGAAVGAWFFATRRGTYWFLGLLAFALFALHAGLNPVYAGGLSMTLALMTSSFLSPWAKDRAQVRRRLGLLSALTVFALFALPGTWRATPVESGTEPEVAASADLGGFPVRLGVWGALPVLVADHAALGLGPGQFQAGFPPYRDAREAELSRGGVCAGTDDEVEHAHNDWLGVFAELGVLGGALWGLFLVLAARASLQALKETDFPTIAMGAAALALLVNALFHAPLTHAPASAPLAFVLFGAVMAREREEHGMRATPLLRGGVAALLVVGALAGAPLVAHGRAFSAYVRARAAEDEDAARSALARALEHLPRSAPALAQHAARAAPGAAARDAWAALLAVRPHDVTARDRLGFHQIVLGEVAAARASWEEALALAPTQPRILRNLVRLELLEGDAARGQELLARLRDTGCEDLRWEAELGSDLVLRGRWSDGARLLLRQDLTELVPEELSARADFRESAGEERVERALRCLANLLWARQHARASDFATAVRSYRQVLIPTRLAAPDGAPAARAELAAAELLAGHPADAAETLDGLALGGPEWDALPDWAGAVLEEAGLQDR
jgi:O-antigen ligase